MFIMTTKTALRIFASIFLLQFLFSTKADRSDGDIDSGNSQNITEFVDDWVENWEAPDVISKMAPYYRAGIDQDGIPVYVIQMGKWNMVSVSELPENLKQEYWKFLEQGIRRMERDAFKNNEQGVVLIADWDGFHVGNLASAEGLRTALGTMSVFPRMRQALKYGFMINTNFAAESFLNIMRPFMGNVMEKIEVYGTCSSQWKPRLLRRIPPSQIPPEYGGEKSFKPLAYGKYKVKFEEA